MLTTKPKKMTTQNLIRGIEYHKELAATFERGGFPKTAREARELARPYEEELKRRQENPK